MLHLQEFQGKGDEGWKNYFLGIIFWLTRRSQVQWKKFIYFILLSYNTSTKFLLLARNNLVYRHSKMLLKLAL